MLKKLILASLLFALPAQAQTLQQAADSTYKLYAGDKPTCSGFFVKSSKGGDDLYMTAAHCGKAKDYNIRIRKHDDDFNLISEQVFFLKKVKTIIPRDVMIFRTLDMSASFNVASIASKKEAAALTLGTPLTAIGFPLTAELTVTRGEFMSKVKGKFNQFTSTFYKNTVPSTHGSSGGGVWIKTETGYKVVGLVSHGFPKANFIQMATSYESIRFALGNLVEFPKMDEERFD